MKNSELLDEYLSGINALNEKIEGLSIENLNYRPDRLNAWTIKEHLIHLIDCEVNAFIRCKSIIAQPFSECYVMDEENWTKNLTRKNEDVQKYIQLFSLIRYIIFDLIKDVPEENWSKD